MVTLVMWLLLIRTPQKVWYVFGNYQTKADCEAQRNEPTDLLVVYPYFRDVIRSGSAQCVQARMEVPR